MLGPITLLRLSRLETDFDEILAKLLPLYSSLLTELQGLGVAEVQLHEPALVMSEASNLREHFQEAYAQLASAELPIKLVTHFNDLGETYPWVVQLPVAAISLDFTRGKNLELMKTYGWSQDKRLGAGVLMPAISGGFVLSRFSHSLKNSRALRLILLCNLLLRCSLSLTTRRGSRNYRKLCGMF